MNSEERQELMNDLDGVAEILASFKESLIEQGFDEEEVLPFCISLLEKLLSPGKEVRSNGM